MSTRMRRRVVIRREEAAERQARYDALTLQEKVDRVIERSLGLSASRREINRLLAQASEEEVLDTLVGAMSK